MLFQTAMISGLAHLPGLCVGQPLPFWAQLAWAVGRSGIFELGAASRGEGVLRGAGVHTGGGGGGGVEKAGCVWADRCRFGRSWRGLSGCFSWGLK
jgi:hypothetical protein